MSSSNTNAVIAGGYRSYLVRFWQSTADGAWRGSAQCVQSGNTVLFGDVVSLLAYVQMEVTGEPAAHAAGAAGINPGVGKFQETL